MNGTRAGNGSGIGQWLRPDSIPLYGYQNGMKWEPVSDGGHGGATRVSVKFPALLVKKGRFCAKP